MRCTKCSEDKQLDLFPPDKRRPLGRQQPCRRCQYLATQAWKRRVGYNRLRRNTRRVRREGEARQLRELLQWARSR